MRLADWLARQEVSHPRAIDLGLDRVRDVAQELGLVPWQSHAIIVGGTNGKGSTATLVAALATAAGRRVGLFTSPHLRRYEERIAIDGQPVDAAALLAAFEAIEAARGAISLTFFEWNTLASLWVFRAQRVDLAVLEVGLGGRLDATSIVDADVAVLSSVGIDHTEWLGPDRESIGREKAGIFRAGRPAVLASPDMPASVFEVGERIGARLLRPGHDYQWQAAAGNTWDVSAPGLAWQGLPAPGISGPRQLANAAAAVCALALLPDAARFLPGRDVAVGVLPRVRLEGRLQTVAGNPSWLLDVAHNAQAASVLAEHLASLPCRGRRLALLGMLGDKDVSAVMQTLAPVIDGWVLAGIQDTPRGLSADDLRVRAPAGAAILAQAPRVTLGCAALHRLARPDDQLVVCGSFHTVGPALDWLGL